MKRDVIVIASADVCAESGCLMRTLNGPPPRLRASAPPEDLTDTVSVPPRPGRRAGRVGRGCVSHSTVCVMSPLTVADFSLSLSETRNSIPQYLSVTLTGQ